MSNGAYDGNPLSTFALIHLHEIFGNHGRVVLFRQASRVVVAGDLAMIRSGNMRTEVACLGNYLKTTFWHVIASPFDFAQSLP